MHHTLKTLLAALAAVALVAVAVGCGGDNKSTSAGNATDAAFIDDMTPHHEGAIQMAKLAKTRAGHSQVKSLADNIISSQQAEISVMGRIRDDMHAMGMNADGHMGMSQHEMGMDMNMSMLERAKPFDKAFIDMMIPHHEGAIRMARAELAKGKQSGLRKIAKDIIAAQNREIAEMRTWRRQWYGSGSGTMHQGGGGSMHGSGM